MKKIIITLIACVSISCNQKKEQKNIVKTYPVISVEERTTQTNISYPTMIEGIINSPVQARISGYITDVLVDEGQMVQKGQPLFRLETQALSQSASSAKSLVDVAQVEVNKLIPLVEKNIVSKVQLETAKANLAKAKASYSEVMANIDYAVVKSPVSGIVGALNYRQGALVSANSTVLTTVSDIKEVYAYFSMNEKEYLDFLTSAKGNTRAEKIKNLPAVQLKLANGEIYTQQGKIEAVTGQIDKNTGSMQFRAVFPNPNQLITNGNSGYILIPQKIENEITIPEVATFEQQGVTFAYMFEKGLAKQVVISVKNRMNNLVIVENGLKKGDTILVQGLNGLKTGTPVKPQIVKMDSIVQSIQPIL